MFDFGLGWFIVMCLYMFYLCASVCFLCFTRRFVLGGFAAGGVFCFVCDGLFVDNVGVFGRGWWLYWFRLWVVRGLCGF